MTTDGRDLTEGSIARGLFSMAGPMLVGLVSVMSMSIVDTYFVGQLGTLPLAAMSFSFPVIFFVGGISTGLSTAASSVVSRSVGRGDRSEARRVTTHTLMLALGLVVSLLVLGFPFMRSLFRLLGATDEAMPLIVDYMTIWLFGMLFFVVPVLGSATFRARGDAKTPMFIMMGATVINLGLDPVLIFGLGPVPHLGIEGAAIATAVSRGIATVVTLWLLSSRDYMRPIGSDVLEGVWASWRKLLRIGAPAAGTNVVVPVTSAILTRLAATYGESAVAAYGAGTRIESLALLVFFALSTGLSPVVGQNWGAGQRERSIRAVRLSAAVALGWGLLTWLAFGLGSQGLAEIFVEGAETADRLALFLVIVPAGYAAQGIFLVGNAALNAIDRPVPAASLSLFRTLGLTAPLAWVGSHWFDLAGIFGSIVVANLVVGIATAVIARYILHRAPTGA